MKLSAIISACSALAFSLASLSATAAPQSTLVTAEQVEWGYLNPLRGDKSPGAANLWGDRTKNMATGMLVRFKKGFSSPPHIHNISYRGVVIKGLMHNDDPTAGKMWMPAGSFWTQPAGEDHITAANDRENMIYLEIDSGPYLVKPSKEHFDNGEAPINMHADNMVWQSVESSPAKTKTPLALEIEKVNLWGSTKNGELGGSLIRIPARFKLDLKASANEFRAVVITGDLNYQSTEQSESKKLSVGSYFSSQGQFNHAIEATSPTVVYIRDNGDYQIVKK